MSMYQHPSAPAIAGAPPLVPATLAIGCFAHLCRERLADALVAFSRDQPHVSVGVHEMGLAALSAALASGDVAMGVLPHAPAPPLAAARLWDDRVCVALRADHPLTALEDVPPAALASALFLVSRREAPGTHRFLADRALPGLGIRTGLRDIDARQILAAVARGDGLALVTEGEGVVHPGVQLRPIAGEGARFAVHAAWRPDRADPVLDALVRHVAGGG